MAWRKRTKSESATQFCLQGERAMDCRERALEARKDEAIRMIATRGWRVV